MLCPLFSRASGPSGRTGELDPSPAGIALWQMLRISSSQGMERLPLALYPRTTEHPPVRQRSERGVDLIRGLRISNRRAYHAIQLFVFACGIAAEMESWVLLWLCFPRRTVSLRLKIPFGPVIRLSNLLLNRSSLSLEQIQTEISHGHTARN